MAVATELVRAQMVATNHQDIRALGVFHARSAPLGNASVK
jgi:hypothetical protein